MDQKTLEGTWEEISLHGSELVGRRVRLTILDEPAPRMELDRALAHLIADARQLVSSFPSGEPAASDEAWSRDVEEKFRRQGFKL